MPRAAIVVALSLTASWAAASIPSMAERQWLGVAEPAHEVIEIMRRLRLTPLRPPPVDLSELRLKAAELSKKVHEAKNPPPGIGVFFGEGAKSTTVTQLLIGGPAESAGIRIGDVFARVDGRAVADNMQIVAALGMGPGPFDVMLGGRPEHVALAKRPPEYLSRAFLAEIDGRCGALLGELATLESDAARPRADLVALAKRAHALSAAIQALGDLLLQAQIKAFTERYRTS
jgi:hypothetical protein